MRHPLVALGFLWILGWTLACMHMPTRTAYQTDGAPLEPDGDQFVGYGGAVGVISGEEAGGLVDVGVGYQHALGPHVALGVDVNSLHLSLVSAGPRVVFNTAASAAEPLALETSLGAQIGYQGVMVGALDGTMVLRINPAARVDGLSGQLGLRVNPVTSGLLGTFFWGNGGLGLSYAAPPGPKRQFIAGLELSRFQMLNGQSSIEVLDEELTLGPVGFWGAQIHLRTRKSPGP